MNLTEEGNLVLFDATHRTVWQSFDSPTNTLLSGQKLPQEWERRLTADTYETNSTPGRFYFSRTEHGFAAFVDSRPPQVYYKWEFGYSHTIANVSVSFTSEGVTMIDGNPSRVSFIRLNPDGRLNVYWYAYENGSTVLNYSELMDIYPSDCGFLTANGSYAVCSQKGSNWRCECQNAYMLSNLGCAPQLYRFLPLEDVSYFSVENTAADEPIRFPDYTTAESCKKACRKNCSCKAAIFRYDARIPNSINGSCYMRSKLLSFSINSDEYPLNSTTYIKVLVPPASPSPSPAPSLSSQSTTEIPEAAGDSSLSTRTIVSVICGFVGLLLLAGLGIGIVACRKGKSKENEELGEDEYEEEDFEELPDLPKKFTYELLKYATADFSRKLGGGGFGSVFDGTLPDGSRVAVKKLDSAHQGKKEFVAEVKTIGSIHHLNLVTLVGFCVEKSHRLLVYEHMSNGSLENWIFPVREERALVWELRRRIIHDVAKGLFYLHEACRQKIAHLDIKPQNILLDSDFHAKISDFGLARLIDRNQSSVVTRNIRGTYGYLAPELLDSGVITEKVDVYSFGVAVAEVVCGRKNRDGSEQTLLSMLREKGRSGRLLDMVDGFIIREDDAGGDYGSEMEKMLMLAIWCAQYESIKRPSMAVVVEVLEGKREIIKELDCDFSSPEQEVIRHEFLEIRSGSIPSWALRLSGTR